MLWILSAYTLAASWINADRFIVILLMLFEFDVGNIQEIMYLLVSARTRRRLCNTERCRPSSFGLTPTGAHSCSHT